MTIHKCSWYGSPEEKLNEHVSMMASEVCPKCIGKPLSEFTGTDLTKTYDPMSEKLNCKRCKGDGLLTNPIKFCSEAPACASNIYPLGTWLRVTIKPKSCFYCEFNNIGDCEFKESIYCKYESSIIVMVTDKMALWLNSENGKWEYVCNICHSKYSGDITQYGSKHLCGGKFIKTRDVDLTIAAFKKLAPLSLGIIECNIEVL